MRLLNLALIGLLAVSVSSCRLIGKGKEPAEPTLETQLTPVKPVEDEAAKPDEAAPDAPAAN